MLFAKYIQNAYMSISELTPMTFIYGIYLYRYIMNVLNIRGVFPGIHN